MKIAIIGYGKMGRQIEALARTRGHEINLIIDEDNRSDLNAEKLAGIDVAIEFSAPASAADNILSCIRNNTAVVSGTTGWQDRLDEVVRECDSEGGSLFHASNYSVGVNILSAINTKLAEIMDSFPQYEVSMSEVHHVHKLDAPSGTAITLAGQITDKLQHKTGWSLEASSPDKLRIDARREGEVMGFHSVSYESGHDVISISHNAKSREGFALGAVMAAEFLHGKTGIFGMKDMLKF